MKTLSAKYQNHERVSLLGENANATVIPARIESGCKQVWFVFLCKDKHESGEAPIQHRRGTVERTHSRRGTRCQCMLLYGIRSLRSCTRITFDTWASIMRAFFHTERSGLAELAQQKDYHAYWFPSSPQWLKSRVSLIINRAHIYYENFLCQKSHSHNFQHKTSDTSTEVAVSSRTTPVAPFRSTTSIVSWTLPYFFWSNYHCALNNEWNIKFDFTSGSVSSDWRKYYVSTRNGPSLNMSAGLVYCLKMDNMTARSLFFMSNYLTWLHFPF